jgi:hypothetical protein
MKDVKDMNGKVIKVGDRVKKHSLINNNKSEYTIATVKQLGTMHSGGEPMVWAGRGGAHHPQACVILSTTMNSN